jgi:hypothetical protein
MLLEMVRFNKELLEKHKERVQSLQRGGGKSKTTQTCVQPSDGKTMVLETLRESGVLGPHTNSYPVLQGPHSLTPSMVGNKPFLVGPPGPFKQG